MGSPLLRQTSFRITENKTRNYCFFCNAKATRKGLHYNSFFLTECALTNDTNQIASVFTSSKHSVQYNTVRLVHGRLRFIKIKWIHTHTFPLEFLLYRELGNAMEHLQTYYTQIRNRHLPNPAENRTRDRRLLKRMRYYSLGHDAGEI